MRFMTRLVALTLRGPATKELREENIVINIGNYSDQFRGNHESVIRLCEDGNCSVQDAQQRGNNEEDVSSESKNGARYNWQGKTNKKPAENILVNAQQGPSKSMS